MEKVEAYCMLFLVLLLGAVMVCFAIDTFQPEPQNRDVVITLIDWYIAGNGRQWWFMEYMIGGEMQPTVTCSSEEYLERLVAYMEREFGAIRLEN